MTKIKKINSKQRLTYDARRQAILEAVIPLFVEQGFRGVTTRLLAQEAGISEALLYQHFPSKVALYTEVQDFLCAESPRVSQDLTGVEPSTETLVWVLFMAAQCMIDPPQHMATNPLFPRLMLQSLMDDGEFARLHTERHLGAISALVTQSIQVAQAQGDISQTMTDDLPAHLKFWFAHHVMAMVHLMNLSDQPVLSYPGDLKALLDYVMLFALRGMGMTDEAIQRHYQGDRLRERFKTFFSPPADF